MILHSIYLSGPKRDPRLLLIKAERESKPISARAFCEVPELIGSSINVGARTSSRQIGFGIKKTRRDDRSAFLNRFGSSLPSCKYLIVGIDAMFFCFFLFMDRCHVFYLLYVCVL